MRRSTVTRALGIAGGVLGGAATFVLAAGCGAVLHLGTPTARRVAATTVDRILEPMFVGRLTIEGLTHLGLDGVGAARVTLRDPSGAVVLSVRNVRASVDLAAALGSLVRGAKDVVLRVTHVQVEDADVLLVMGPDGTPSIAHAFDPKVLPKTPPAPGGRGVDVDVVDIRLMHAHARGALTETFPIDVDLTDVLAAFRSDRPATSIDVRRLAFAFHGMPEGIDPAGNVQGHVRIPSNETSDLDLSWTVAALVAGQQATTRGAILGKRVDAQVDVPAIDPARLQRVVSSSPLVDPASAHIECHGTLPALTATAHVAVGPGGVDVTAGTRTGSPTIATVTVTAAGIDLHSFSAGSGHTSLSARTVATAEFAGGAVSGQFDLETAAATLEGQSIPSASVHGRFTNDTVTGSAHVDEEGAPVDIDYQVHPIASAGSAQVVDFDIRANARELGRVPRLARAVRGSARLRARGRIQLAQARLAANAEAEVDHIDASKGEIHLGTGRLDAKVAGPFAALAVDANVSGSDLSVGGRAFTSFDVRAKGGSRAAVIDASFKGDGAPDVSLHANVHPGSVTTIDGAELALHHKGIDVVAHVGSVRLDGAVTHLDDVRIDGVGKALVHASATVGPGLLALKANADDVDLARVGRLLDQEQTLEHGRVAFAVDVNAAGGSTNGSVKVDLFGGRFPSVDGASGRLEANLHGRHLAASLRGAIGSVGWATVVADDIVLGGEVQDPTSWRNAVGHVVLDASVDLAKLESALPQGTLPLDETTGTVHLTAKAGRAQAAERLDFDAELATKGLGFVAGPPGSTIESRGTDAEVALHFAGRSGQASLTARARDAKGVLVQLVASAKPDLDRLVRGGAMAPREVENLPLHLEVDVPRRAIQDLPVVGERVALHGDIEGALMVDGTAMAPRVELKARAFDLTGSVGPHATLVNVDVLGTYAGDKAKIVAKVARPKGFVAEVEANGNVRVSDALSSTGSPSPWTASVKGHFDGLPMEVIPTLAEKRVRGKLTGDVTLEGLHESAKADVNLALAELQVAHTRYKGASIKAHAGDGAVSGQVRLDQEDGFAEAHLDAGLVWGASVAPTLDTKRPLSASLVAKAVQIAAVQPFVGESVSELEGRVDADAKVSYDLGGKSGKVVGNARLRDGLFDLPTAGGEFHEVEAKVTMDPMGTIKVEDLSARGTTGRLTGSATVKLEGTQLQTAQANVSIKRGDKLPVEINGTSLGTVWGDIGMKARFAPDGKDVTAEVSIPRLYVALPQSTGNTVQDMAPNPDVTIGARATGGRFASLPVAKPEEPRPPGSMRAHVHVAFGKEVWVSRDTMLKLQLHDGPTVDITDKTHVSGKVTAGPGTVEVQSKKFELETASVTFVGDDPSKPQITASAYWDAPSKTRVIVDVTGTPEHLDINLRSEPDQLPKDAILSLVLFGDENGSFGSSQSTPSGDNEDVNTGAGVAGGVVTQGINKAISGVANGAITTRVDTSESQNPRPELEVQISKDVSATVAYNLGLPPPGQNPDRTQVILDYRFIRNWSLLSTFGDAGSTIFDLLWQYRY